MGKKGWIILGLAALAVAGFIFDGNAGDETSLPAFSQPVVMPTAAPLNQTQAQVLPCAMENGELLAQCLTEDPQTGAAALMLYNPGSRGISFAGVAVQQGERTLYFFATWIPAGSRVLITEQTGQALSGEPVTQCRSLTVRWERFSAEEQEVRLIRTPEGQMIVANMSGRDLSCVVLRCRYWSTEQDCWLGGNADCIHIPALRSGESRVISWEETASVVAVTIEN